jgi:hypothetical protein
MKKKKIKKKKKRKHQKLTKALNSAVKIRTLVLNEEATWAGTHPLNASRYLNKMSNYAVKAVTKAYRKLFERDLHKDMVDAICDGDEYLKYLKTMARNK